LAKGWNPSAPSDFRVQRLAANHKAPLRQQLVRVRRGSRHPRRTATVFVTIPAIAAKLFLAIRQEAPERDLDRFAEAVTADATKQHLSRNARARAK
jgi:hypothetical protein